VAVDQEGGRVRCLRENFPMLEAPRYYGDGLRLDRYRDDLLRVCERLREIGFTLNLVPTVDLFDTEPGHVLNRRTFSDDPDTVIRFALETMAVHRRQGLCCCAKHFPGLGRSKGDPHHVLSAAELSEEDYFERELVPFKAVVEAGIEALMVTHLALPHVDDEPAIVSAKIIGGWLRERLGFTGLVITDDLLMSGAVEIAPPSRLAVQSFEAGADVLLFGQDIKRAAEAIDVFGDECAAGGLSPERCAAAAARIDEFRRRMMEE
jgi:beta-N-acetylhexosaminidase